MKPISAYAFPHHDDGTIGVLGGTEPYTIVPSSQGATCSCPAGRFRGRCKHLRRAAELHPGLVILAPIGVPALEAAVPPGPPEGDVIDDEIPPDAFVSAMEQETVAVLGQCAEQLEQLERRVAVALEPSDVMRKYRAARERLAAERAHEAA